MREISITSVDEGQRLDKYLAKFMPEAPKSFFYKMMRKKNIVLNGKKAAGMEKLAAGDVVKLLINSGALPVQKNSIYQRLILHQRSRELSLILSLRMRIFLL